MNKNYTLIYYARFFAAFSVLIYHYLYRGLQSDGFLSNINFDYKQYFMYGHLGVQLFFMISGFVIVMSIEGKSLKHFIIGRILRLYPAYWFAIVFIIIIVSALTYQNISLFEIVMNMTMLQQFFGVAHLDGVFWTLSYELVFYFWIAILLIVGLDRLFIGCCFILSFGYLSLFFDLPDYIRVIFLTDWGCYFVIGIAFYCIQLNKGKSIFILFSSAILGGLKSSIQASTLTLHYGDQFSPLVQVLAIAFFLCFFIVNGFYSPRLSKLAILLGGLTYPLYLIHQKSGYVIINALYGKLSFIPSVLSTTMLIFLFSFLIFSITDKQSFFFGEVINKIYRRFYDK